MASNGTPPLVVKWPDAPAQIYRSGNDYLYDVAAFILVRQEAILKGISEAFANLYKNFALTLFANLQGEKPTAEMLDFPNVTDGVREWLLLKA
jgi:hypothetical protein